MTSLRTKLTAQQPKLTIYFLQDIVKKIIKEEMKEAAKASVGQADNAAAKDAVSPQDVASQSTNDNIEEAKVRVTLDVESTKSQAELIATIVQVGSQDVASQSVTAEKEKPEAVAATTQIAPGHNPDFDAKILPNRLDTQESVAKMIEDIVRFRDEQAADPRELCVSCNERGTKLCGKCNHASYCSRECQVADWSIHKHVCSAFAGHASDENRPSPEHHRILYFPTFQQKPELHWAVYSETQDRPRLELEHHEVSEFKKVAGIPAHQSGMHHSAINLAQALGNRSVFEDLIRFELMGKTSTDLNNAGVLATRWSPSLIPPPIPVPTSPRC